VLKKWEYKALPIIPEQVKYKAVEKTKAQLAVVKTIRFFLPLMPKGKGSLSARKSLTMVV
jgi:hypothetical protein